MIVREVFVIDNYNEIDRRNQEIFKNKGLKVPSEQLYSCVICGDKISLDDSISSQGHNLICNKHCCGEIFSDYAEAFKWMRGA